MVSRANRQYYCNPECPREPRWTKNTSTRCCLSVHEALSNGTSNILKLSLYPPRILIRIQAYAYMYMYVRDRLLHRRSRSFFVSCNALMAMASAEGLETSMKALQDGNGGDGAEPQRCHSWLPNKRRFCAAHAIRGLQYVPALG